MLQVPEENLPLALKVLEPLLPDSVVAYEWISVHLRWQASTPRLKLVTLSPGIKSGVFICLADGLADFDKIYGVVYAPPGKTDELSRVLLSTESIHWDRIIHIACLLDRHLSVLTEVLKIKGFKHTGDFHIPCSLLYMPVEKAMMCPLPKLPENVRFGPMDLSHFETIFQHWSMRDDVEFKPIVEKMITENTTVGIFASKDDGSEELASMVLQAEYGAVGLLQTVPGFERRGYASVALAHQTINLANTGVIPYAAVLLQNKASIQLFRKIGYEELGVSTWVIMTKL